MQKDRSAYLIKQNIIQKKVKTMGLRKLKRSINKKKVVAAASLCALATSALVAGAFFTDKETETVRATAGTVDIELTDSSAIDADGDGILNPGDTGTLSYNINNVGSKSVDVKTVIEIASGNVLNQDDSEYTLAGDLITEAPVFSEDGKKITYTTDSVVLNGTIETETGAVGTNTDQDYTFTFDIDAKNKFQDDNVKITYTVYAKQHRNTEDADWAELINKVVTPGGDDEGETNTGYQISAENFPNTVIRGDADGFDVNDDGYISEDEKQASYTPSASVDNSFKGADKLSDKLVLENQNTPDLVVDSAEHIKDIDASNQGLTSIDVSEVTDLEKIDVSGNDALTSIDLSQNTNIKDVIAGPDTNITSVKLPADADAEQILADMVNNGYQLGEVSGDGTVTVDKQDPVELGIPIDEEHFPDEHFRQHVKNNFDKDGNNWLSKEEIDKVTSVDVANKLINDLTGIQYFTNTTYINCYNNGLTKIDVSKNTKLEDLRCHSCRITTLDITNNPELKTLICSNNSISSLDLTKNPDLSTLDFSDNNLSTINVTKNIKLTELKCSRNKLRTLNIGNNTALETVLCNGNKITTLNLTNTTSLTKLDASGNNLTGIDVSKNTKLKELSLSNDKGTINTLDLSNNLELEKIRTSNVSTITKVILPNNNKEYTPSDFCHWSHTWQVEGGEQIDIYTPIEATGQTLIATS